MRGTESFVAIGIGKWEAGGRWQRPDGKKSRFVLFPLNFPLPFATPPRRSLLPYTETRLPRAR